MAEQGNDLHEKATTDVQPAAPPRGAGDLCQPTAIDRHVGKSEKRLLILSLCWLQCLLEISVASSVYDNAGWLLPLGPTMCLTGFAICGVAIYRASLQLFAFGLTPPIFTTITAFLIAVFAWEKEEASHPSAIVLGIYAWIAISWSLVASIRFTSSSMLRSFHHPKMKFRFSIRSLLISSTFVCIAVALVRQNSDDISFFVFTTYGTTVLGLCLILAFLFHMRISPLAPRRPQPSLDPRAC